MWYVYIYTHVHIHMCIHIYIYIIYIYIYIFVHIHMWYVYICIHIYVYIYVYLCVYKIRSLKSRDWRWSGNTQKHTETHTNRLEYNNGRECNGIQYDTINLQQLFYMSRCIPTYGLILAMAFFNPCFMMSRSIPYHRRVPNDGSQVWDFNINWLGYTSHPLGILPATRIMLSRCQGGPIFGVFGVLSKPVKRSIF